MLVTVDAIAKNASRRVDRLLQRLEKQGVLVMYAPNELEEIREILDDIEDRGKPLMDLIDEQGKEEM